MKPLFFTVTGSDFARAIAWAKANPNQVSLQILASRVRLPSEVGLAKPPPPPKLPRKQQPKQPRKWITADEARKLGYFIP